MTAALREFAKSEELVIALVLILVDLVLGAAAAFNHKRFHLAYVADFARNDLMKLLGWFVLFAGGVAAPGAEIGVGSASLSLSDVAVAVFALIGVAIGGSITNSLKELGLFPNLSNIIAGNEKLEPPPGPPPE